MEYCKIETVFKRDAVTKRIIPCDYSLPEFSYLSGNEWVFTEKVDGTNIRINWDGSVVTFGGRTDNAQIPAHLFNRLLELFGESENNGKFLGKFGDSPAEVVLYGEGYGAKIQKGGVNYIADGVDFVLFDVNIGGVWLQRDDVEDIADFFGVRVVPIIGYGTIQDMVNLVSCGFCSCWGNFQAEGIVARPRIELITRLGNRVITKLKMRDFK